MLKLLFYCVQSKEQTVYNIHSLLQTTPSIKDNHKPQDVPVGGAYHAHLETFLPDTKTFFWQKKKIIIKFYKQSTRQMMSSCECFSKSHSAVIN